MNWELPDVQAWFRKSRRTRDQIANICWIIEKAKEFEKNIYICFIDYAKDHNKLENSWRDGNTKLPDLPPKKSVWRSRSKLEPNTEQQISSKLGKEYVKGVSCHPAYLTYMQGISCEMLDWMNHKLESRLSGEISTTSLSGQKTKRN